MGLVLNNKGYQMIELFILLQLIQVLTPASNLINFYEDQKEVGVRTSISHKYGTIRNLKLTRHVFVKDRCPRRQQSRNMAKISKSYILTPPHPPGACDVSQV